MNSFRSSSLNLSSSSLWSSGKIDSKEKKYAVSIEILRASDINWSLVYSSSFHSLIPACLKLNMSITSLGTPRLAIPCVIFSSTFSPNTTNLLPSSSSATSFRKPQSISGINSTKNCFVDVDTMISGNAELGFSNIFYLLFFEKVYSF